MGLLDETTYRFSVGGPANRSGSRRWNVAMCSVWKWRPRASSVAHSSKRKNTFQKNPAQDVIHADRQRVGHVNVTASLVTFEQEVGHAIPVAPERVEQVLGVIDALAELFRHTAFDQVHCVDLGIWRAAVTYIELLFQLVERLPDQVGALVNAVGTQETIEGARRRLRLAKHRQVGCKHGPALDAAQGAEFDARHGWEHRLIGQCAVVRR